MPEDIHKRVLVCVLTLEKKVTVCYEIKARMQPGDVLRVCLLSIIFGFILVNGDEGSDFLDYKEEQARRIAESAIANYYKKCGTITVSQVN